MTAEHPTDPIDNIQWRRASELRANHWNPNRVFKPEMELLARSILTTGWIQPVLANAGGLIIDGFHRWRLAQDNTAIREKYLGLIPVAVLAVPDDRAMAITVRINRAKGHHVAVEMHKLVTLLVTEYLWTKERVAEEIGAERREVDLLLQEGVLEQIDVKNYTYGRAWYPVEAKNEQDAQTKPVRPCRA